jgi:hypothetical protein
MNMNYEQRRDIADSVRVPAHVNIEAICQEYAPYHSLPEFNVGFRDYLNGELCDTAHRGVEQQAYDRGYEAGMRVTKFARKLDLTSKV